VSDVQFKVLSRLILHLVDTFPCMGGATLTLLEVPHVDYKLKLLGCPLDLMSLPGIKDVFRWAVQVGGLAL
jgi:Ca2+-dependent lipid-binding protein